MIYLSLLDFLKIVLTLVLLVYASWCDWCVREVSDKVWIIFIGLGLPLTLLQIFLEKCLWLLYLLALSFTVMFGLSLLLSYLDLFGGADLKALVCLSLVFPWLPKSITHPLKVFPIPSFSFLINSLILCVVTIIPLILIKNLVWKLKNKKSLFEGFEDEPLPKKIVMVALVGFKVKKEKLIKTPHYSLAEETRKINGKLKRNLKISSALTISELLENVGVEELPEEVWVTPRIPMIIFILGGFVLTILVGDLLYMVLAKFVWW